MSGAESSPPTPRAGFRDPAPVEYRISRGELHHYGRFPNGDHYYTYVVKGRSGGGARLNGFLVGALVGLCTGAWWQRRHCHKGHASARMTKNDYSDPNAVKSKNTSIQ